MKMLALPLVLSLLASSTSTFFVPPVPLLAPHPPVIRQAARRLLQQHVHAHEASDVSVAPRLSHSDNLSALPPSITELLEQMEDLHRLLADDRAYLHSFLPDSSSYPLPYPPPLMARIGDGLAQLDWLAGVVSAGRQDVDNADFASAGRHVRLMWKEYREKVRPFVLDVVWEVEVAVKKEGAWKYGQQEEEEEEEEEREEEEEVVFAEQEEPQEEEKDKEEQGKQE